jgi:hypothetical protein
MNNQTFRLLIVVLLTTGVSWTQGAMQLQAGARQSMVLTAQEESAALSAVLSDARVRQIVGSGRPRVIVGDAQPDKNEAVAFYRGETQKPPTHHVWATVFNPATNKAAEVFMSLEQNKVLKVQEIEAADVPLSREDVEEALALAKVSPDVRRAVGSSMDQFVVSERSAQRTAPFTVRSLRVRSADANDPCTLDRCLDLIFKTDSGFLPLRAEVDLTQRTVRLINSPGKGKHL